MGSAAPRNRCSTVPGLSVDRRVNLANSTYAQAQPRPASEFDQEINQLPAQLDSSIIAGEIAKQVGFVNEMCSLVSPFKGQLDKLTSPNQQRHTCKSLISTWPRTCIYIELCGCRSALGPLHVAKLKDIFYA